MTKEMLGRLARRELAPKEIAAVLRHAGTCPDCARLALTMVDGEAGVLQAMVARDAVLSAHPDHEELVAYADHALGPVERQIVDSHLEDCGRCRTDVDDLLALQKRTVTFRARWRLAVIAAAAAAIVTVVVLQRSETVDPAPPPSHTVPAVAIETVAPPVTVTTVTTNVPPDKPRYAKGEWERLVHAAVTSGVLPFPKDFARKPDVLRGSDERETAKLQPSGIYVDDTTPRFSWPARGAASYVVSIYSGDDEVAQSEPLTATAWTPAKPLPRGKTYVWQVEAVSGETREILPAPPAPPATFRVVSARDHEELALARREHPDDHTLHAVLAARAGLREEALAAWARAKQ